MQLNQINQVIKDKNREIHDELNIEDSQYDGEQYFAKVSEPYYNEVSLYLYMKDFGEYFPHIDPIEFPHIRIRFRFSLKITYGIGYNVDNETKFIFDKKSELHDIKLTKINQIYNDNVTIDQLYEFIDDDPDAFYDMLKDEFVNHYINMFNDFSIEL